MDGPAPLDLTDPSGRRNPIRDLFDEIGLPWREARGDVVGRCGIRRHPAYGWDVVPIATERPLTDGLFVPLWSDAGDNLSPRLPIAEFSGLSALGRDARLNIETAARPIANRLGLAPIGRRYNTLHCAWQAGAASIGLSVWPPELQTTTSRNPAHERDPRLATACHITIATGYRPPLRVEELRWLESFEPLLPIGERVPTEQDIAHRAAPIGLLEFTREPSVPLAGLLGQTGRSRGGEALILCSDQLYVIAAEELIGFRVDRLTPAKGGGGSWLTALCRAAETSGPVKSVTLVSAGGTHDLDEVGPAFAGHFGKPCELASPYPDV